jgi:hypothetical protein
MLLDLLAKPIYVFWVDNGVVGNPPREKVLRAVTKPAYVLGDVLNRPALGVLPEKRDSGVVSAFVLTFF